MPQLDGSVPAGGGEYFAFRREITIEQALSVSGKHSQLAASPHLPQARRGVDAGCRHNRSHGREFDIENVRPMTLEHQHAARGVRQVCIRISISDDGTADCGPNAPVR